MLNKENLPAKDKLKKSLLAPLLKLFSISKPKASNLKISDALLKLFSQNYIEKMSLKHSEEELIEAVARDRQIESQTLLDKVADLLHLESQAKIPAIDGELLKRLSSEPKRLHKLGVVPVDSMPKHTLICSNPENINMKKFLEEGVKVKLALGSSVEAAWQRFFSVAENQIQEGNNVLATDSENSLTVQPEQVKEIIYRIAMDSFSMGASEVFLGYPEVSLFEFNIGQNRYRGKIHKDVLKQAMELVQNEGQQLYSLDKQKFALQTCIVDGSPRLILRPEKNQSQVSQKELYNSPKLNDKIRRKHKSAILLDDDPRFLRVLKNIMEGNGWTVHSTCSGLEALELTLDPDTRPDLVISDIRMPEIDGEEVLVKIKAALPKLPVVMLTGENDRMLEAKLALLGADAFARKQDDPEILLSWCQAIINKTFLENNPSLH